MIHKQRFMRRGGMSEVRCEILTSHSIFNRGRHRGAWICYTAPHYTHTDALCHPGDRSMHASLSNIGLGGRLICFPLFLNFGQHHQFLRKFNHPCPPSCRLCKFGGKMGKMHKNTHPKNTHTCTQNAKDKHKINLPGSCHSDLLR